MNERVWDRFLTEQDKAHLATMPRHGRVGFGERPALLMIDFYRMAFGDRPEPLLEAIKTWPGSCGLAGWQALSYAQELLGVAREVGIPVIHTTGPGDMDIPLWIVYRDSTLTRPPELDPAEQDRRRRRFDIVSEVAPIPGEIVLRKSGPSAFFSAGPGLASHLYHLGVDTLLVAGEATSGCVRATVVDGDSYRFRMIVVEECVFDRHEVTHAINLFDMNQKSADVVPLTEALGYLRGLQASGFGPAAGPRFQAPRH